KSPQKTASRSPAKQHVAAKENSGKHAAKELATKAEAAEEEDEYEYESTTSSSEEARRSKHKRDDRRREDPWPYGQLGAAAQAAVQAQAAVALSGFGTAPPGY
ncbi:unnamed protein product, partial [Symbiodinium pilosum]